MTEIIAYLPNYSAKQRHILGALAHGIPGSKVRPLAKYKPCDIAIIFGGYKRAYRPTWPKREILERHQGRQLLMVESGFVKRGEYYQVGWGGFAGEADFRTEGVPMDRWEAMGVKTKPWKRRDGPIVVCGQVPWDTQVQDMDHAKWCRETVDRLQAVGYDVWFRPHPRVREPGEYGISGVPVDTQKIGKTAAMVRAAVTWNSTSAVDFALAGVPVVACDPSSIARPIAAHSVDALLADNLRFPSRKAWLAGLGYSQWTVDEMREGLPWRHLTR